MADREPRVKVFRSLHESGCFLIPNPWDVGSAIVLEQMGFSALATTSAGFAWTLGRRDNGVTLDEALAHYRAVAAAVRVPVNADFERAFATEPEEVAANVTHACATGIAGLSVEDSTHDAEHPLFDFDLAVERVRAARRAIDATGTGVCSPAARRVSSPADRTSPRPSAAFRPTRRRAPTACSPRESRARPTSRPSCAGWHQSR